MTACALMKDPRVIAFLAEKTGETLQRLELKADDVIRDIHMLANVDQNELTQWAVGACRYCHGDGHGYQRTPAEYRQAMERYLANEADRKLRRGETEGDRDLVGLLFPVLGGVGFDPRKDPHSDCPECFGEGQGREVLKDTRKLSPAARKLYAGIKRTKNGIEVMTRSQDKALDLAARHTGVVKSSMEVTGKNGGPLQHAGAVVALTTDNPIEAAREYQKLMGG